MSESEYIDVIHLNFNYFNCSRPKHTVADPQYKE